MFCPRRVASAFLMILLLCSGVLAQEAAPTARQAWASLVGEKAADDPAYAFVENDPKLPNVLIYGDSISIHYTPFVRQELAGKANVYRIYRNGSDSSTVIDVLTNMDRVMRDPALADPWDFSWDVIQLNVGLHDLKYVTESGKYDTENGTQVTSIPEYKKNLREIFAYLKQAAPDAKLVFATTTAVPENSTGRQAGDAARYNQAARDVIAWHPGVIINDLYALSEPNQEAWWTKPGNVHFNEDGRRAQAQQAAQVILKALQ